MAYPDALFQSRIATAIPSEQETGLPSFGENLRREREKRNITLEQISQSTKIGTRMLQALEEDRFSQLPGGIFNKGFVRAYARHLGLDEDQTVADYLQASGDAPPAQPELSTEETVPQIEASADAPPRQLPWGLFAAILLLAALALSIWSHRQRKHEGAATQSPPRSATSQPLVENAQPAAAAPSSATAEPDKPSLSPVPIRSAETTPPQITPTSSRTPADASVQPAAEGFVVVVLAREESWTAITSDGRTVYSGVLAAGDQRSIRGRKRVVVKAGNAGGIDLLFNGTRIDQPGKRGEVRTITLGPDGVASSGAPQAPMQ